MRAPRLLVAALLSSAPALALAGPDGPPETRQEKVVDTLHGEQVKDPYRWLEGDPEGGMTEEVASWTDAQNGYTRQTLENLPGREAVAKRLTELLTVGSISAPRMAGKHYFYRERKGDEDQSPLYLRIGHDGEPRLLLDPSSLDDKGLVSLDWFSPNPSGELLAIGTSKSGSEDSTLHLLDVASGEWLSDVIPNKVRGVSWLPDGRHFTYGHLNDPADPYSRHIRLHEVGRHWRHDPTLMIQESQNGGPFAYPSSDGRWLVMGRWRGWSKTILYVADLNAVLRGEGVKPVELLDGPEAQASGDIFGDVMFMETTLDAPNGKVVRVDLNRPDKQNWQDLIPHREDAVLKNTQLARGMLICTYEVKASTRIERFRLDGTPLGELKLPGIGTASLSTDSDRSEAFLTFTSFNTPTSIFRVDLNSGERTLWGQAEAPVDPSIVEVKQVTYESKDKTKVTMFLVHKKGLKLDGDNPTWLTGYGGFNISRLPRFSSSLFQWLENGGVYALPNLRGGGEYGEAWHQAGMLANKQNVFDDFVAAAEWLIANKYTKPQRLAITGGSNGGLLTGATVVQRPDLFAAAISAVPLLDMLRYQRFLIARFWVPEYGSAEDAEQFGYLKAYSPYHNVKQGTRYPAVLFTAGENDSRVHPCHARKMAAAMQAATASDPKQDPILLWVERDAGHGQGKPLSLRIQEATDQRMFLMWQLGMLESEQK